MQPVHTYIEKQTEFSEMLILLRKVFLKTSMTETIKWGIPTYTVKNKNVAAIAAFKNHCAIWFYQGALLQDPLKVLINAQEGKTQALRHWRFKVGSTINESDILAYLEEAIENEKNGLRVKIAKKPLVIPNELDEVLIRNNLKERFKGLKLSVKREFCDFIAQAKQANTKKRRIDKILPMIKSDIGLNDKYKNN